MVDKENNQWEDTDNINNSGDEQIYSYDDDDSDQEEDQDYESYEDYEEDDDNDDDSAKKKSSPFLILIIFLLLLGLIAFIAVPKFMGGGKNTSVAENNNAQVQNQNNLSVEQNSQSSEDLTDTFFDAAGGGNEDMISVNFNDNGETNVETGEGNDIQVATVTDIPNSEGVSNNDLFDNQENTDNNSEEQGNNAIMVVYNKVSKANPFKPPVAEQSDDNPFETVNNIQFEIIEPPVSSVPDENLTRLLQTQISGILYDDESPSAIVNLNGMDQFVKQGDTISGYKIENITKDKVQISYKNNSYVASVGELFTRGSLEKSPAVVNLENKFAGRYKNNN